MRGHGASIALGATYPARPGVSFPLTLHFPECVAGVYWHRLNRLLSRVSHVLAYKGKTTPHTPLLLLYTRIYP